jgi:hypothetical protein
MRIQGIFGFVLFVCAGVLHASTPIETAFNRIYNFDFRGSQEALTQYTASRPEDPLGHAVRASAYLFSELSRMRVLDKEFLTNDKRIADEARKQPDPAVKAAFFQAAEQANQRAQEALSKDPNDRNALLALCITKGAERDYAALIDKRLRDSLTYAKESQTYAVRLLKIDPQAYDAYLTTGFSEYLVGNLPFFVRWFVRFEDTDGSKESGMRKLKVVAERGRYLKPFAQLLLAMFYLREKKPQESRALLADLAQAYPENSMIRRELARLSTAKN